MRKPGLHGSRKCITTVFLYDSKPCIGPRKTLVCIQSGTCYPLIWPFNCHSAFAYSFRSKVKRISTMSNIKRLLGKFRIVRLVLMNSVPKLLVHNMKYLGWMDGTAPNPTKTNDCVFQLWGQHCTH